MNITRGDTKSFKFARKSNGEIIKTIADKIYYTVKENTITKNIVFQKTIEDMTFDSNGYYHFSILPQDTNNLYYGEYYYDIEVKIGNTYVKTISKGILNIEREITHVENEV